jgi:hypothetical protein
MVRPQRPRKERPREVCELNLLTHFDDWRLFMIRLANPQWSPGDRVRVTIERLPANPTRKGWHDHD